MVPVELESLLVVCASFGVSSHTLVCEAPEKQAFNPVPLLNIVFKQQEIRQ
jgi:hypothetical protein